MLGRRRRGCCVRLRGRLAANAVEEGVQNDCDQRAEQNAGFHQRVQVVRQVLEEVEDTAEQRADPSARKPRVSASRSTFLTVISPSARNMPSDSIITIHMVTHLRDRCLNIELVSVRA
jgi:hypothetical protein